MSEVVSRPNRTLKYLAAAGLVGPILFTAVWLILGFLDPTYSHLEDPISNLGAIGARDATAQFFNFVVFGLLLIAFALGLQLGLPPGSWVGPATLGVAGAGLIAAGIFPLVSPTINPEEILSPPNLPHFIAMLFIVFGLALAPLLLSPRLKRDPGWQNLRVYSVATTVVAVLLFVLFFSASAFVPGGAGLQQRIVLAVLSVWIVVMAIRLLHQSPASVSPSS